MSGFVYVIESASGHYKVGYSINPQKRLSQLATASAEALTLRATFPGTIQDERELHEALEPWRIGREWFADCQIIRALIGQGVVAAEVREIDPSAHPLVAYSKAHRHTLSAIAAEAGCSRMSLHRIINGGQNATLSMLERISAATDGRVPVSALLRNEQVNTAYTKNFQEA